VTPGNAGLVIFCGSFAAFGSSTGTQPVRLNE